MRTSKLGQNFLIDKQIALKEIESANLKKNDIVLEIGPGNGILTQLLAEKVKKVIAIEIDKNLVRKLKDILPQNVLLINNDVLNVDFKKLPRFNKIVSNLPFQISSLITFKFLEYEFDIAILIYQKEFAERMVAVPGNKNYSRLTVGVYYKAYCEALDVISKNCFYPVPKVDSQIIRLKPRNSPPFQVCDEVFFFDFIRVLFNSRRKKIKTTLKLFYDLEMKSDYYSEKRVEQLTPDEIGHLCNKVYNLRNKII